MCAYYVDAAGVHPSRAARARLLRLVGFRGPTHCGVWLQVARIDCFDDDDSDDSAEDDVMERSLRMNESWQQAHAAGKAAAREDAYIAEAVGAGRVQPNPSASLST